MSKSNQEPRPRQLRGPERGQQVVVRMQRPQLAAVDGWVALNGGAYTRPEAVRRLVNRALSEMRDPPRADD